MGMRPEIKIPPNPMAALRKAPRPQPKNDFWIEEYRREKQQDERPQQIPRPVPPSYSYTNRDLDDEGKRHANVAHDLQLFLLQVESITLSVFVTNRFVFCCTILWLRHFVQSLSFQLLKTHSIAPTSSRSAGTTHWHSTTTAHPAHPI